MGLRETSSGGVNSRIRSLGCSRSLALHLVRAAKVHASTMQLQQLSTLVLGLAAICSDASRTTEGSRAEARERAQISSAVDKFAATVVRRWRLLSSVRRRLLAQLPKGAKARRGVIAVIPGLASPVQVAGLVSALVSSPFEGKGLGARLSPDDARWIMNQLSSLLRSMPHSCRREAEKAMHCLLKLSGGDMKQQEGGKS